MNGTQQSWSQNLAKLLTVCLRLIYDKLRNSSGCQTLGLYHTLFCYLYSCEGKKAQEFSIIPKVAFIWIYLKMLAQVLTQTDI